MIGLTLFRALMSVLRTELIFLQFHIIDLHMPTTTTTKMLKSALFLRLLCNNLDKLGLRLRIFMAQ